MASKLSLNEWAERVHKIAHAKDFYLGPCLPRGMDNDRDLRCPLPQDTSVCRATRLMLIVTEVAEACEADRIGDHANFREELADALIRVLDLCYAENIDIEAEVERKTQVNAARDYKGKAY